MRVSILGIVVPALAIIGCATVSQMTATGGSRADGVVRLSFEAGMFDKIAIDEAAALKTARSRCSTWGYTDAEPFGGITRQCQAMSGYGCTRWFVTKEYQCTSGGAIAPVATYAAPAPAPAAPAAVAVVAAPPPPPMPIAVSGDAPGTINLGDGVKLVPAKTLSGYCIKAPSGYVGTGSVNRPAITNARPICS